MTFFLVETKADDFLFVETKADDFFLVETKPLTITTPNVSDIST